MKYYKLPTGELVSTQADVKAAGFKLDQAPVEEVPNIDKEKLRVYINNLRPHTITTVKPDFTVSLLTDTAPGVEPSFNPDPVSRWSGESVLASIDGKAKGIDVDKIVTTIMNAKGHVLARFAKAIAYAYISLGKS